MVLENIIELLRHSPFLRIKQKNKVKEQNQEVIVRWTQQSLVYFYKINVVSCLLCNLGLTLPGSPKFGWEDCMSICFQLPGYSGRHTQTSRKQKLINKSFTLKFKSMQINDEMAKEKLKLGFYKQTA